MTKTLGAHGLFAATGKKSKPVHVYDDDGNIKKALYLPRDGDDFYPTPPEPTRAFCKAEGLYLKRFEKILEPCAGDGAMANDLSECLGMKVEKSDICDRGCGAEIKSFYDVKSIEEKTCIITNPPFNLCHGDAPFIRHALDELKATYVAMLLPWNWLGAKSKANFWNGHPCSRIYLMRWRIDFTGMGSPPMLNAWYVWDELHDSDECFLRMIDKVDDPRQPQLL